MLPKFLNKHRRFPGCRAASRFASIGMLVLGVTAIAPYDGGELAAQENPAKEIAGSQERIAQLIQSLVDDKYSQREQAEAELVALGMLAAEQLLQEIIDGEPESAIRCGRVLEKVALESNDEQDVNRIGLILHVLTENGRPWFRGTAENLRAGWQRQRRQRIIDAIEDLGVGVETDPSNYRVILPQRVRLGVDVSMDADVEAATTENEGNGEPRPLSPVLGNEQLNAELAAILTASDSVLNQRMEEVAKATSARQASESSEVDILAAPDPLAGDPFRFNVRGGVGMVSNNSPIALTMSTDLEDLSRVAELANDTAADIYLHLEEAVVDQTAIDALEQFQRLRSLQLSRCRYDAATMLDFAATHPNVQFTSVGHDAFLGIATTETSVDAFEGVTTACRIITVVGESAAEQAGLQVGEYVLALDGIKLTEFNQMIVIIASHELGDTLRVRVGNAETGDIRELEVTLQARPPGS